MAGTAVAVVVAAFLTWYTGDSGPVDSQSFAGVGAEDIQGFALEGEVFLGYLTIVLAAVVLGFAITRGCGALPLTAAIIGVVMGSLIALIGLAGLAVDDPVTFTDKVTGEEVEGLGAGIDWNVGIGVWLTLVSGAAMLVVSVVGLVKRR
jgi:hypothetical protein